MKTTFLPRVAATGLLTALWLATSAYTTPDLGAFRPATDGGTLSGPQLIGALHVGQLRASQYALDDPATMQQLYIQALGGPMLAIGTEPTLPGSLFDSYASTDFTEFDQLVMPR